MNSNKHTVAIAVLMGLLGVASPSVYALTLVNRDAQIVINGSATLIVRGDYLCTGDSRIKIADTASLRLTGDFVNNNDTLNPLDVAAAGFVRFDGATVPQEVRGTAAVMQFRRVAIHNTEGLSLARDVEITHVLQFAGVAHFMDVQSRKLTLHSAATLSGGGYVVATGDGMLARKVEGAGTYAFPLTSASGAVRTPLTLQFTAGSFDDAVVQVNVVAAKHPATHADVHLTRYWNIRQEGISAFTCVVTGHYVEDDVVGPEGGIWSAFYNGNVIQNYRVVRVSDRTLSATLSSFGSTGALTGNFNPSTSFGWDDGDSAAVFTVFGVPASTYRIIGYDEIPGPGGQTLFETNAITFFDFRNPDAFAGGRMRRVYRLVEDDGAGTVTTNATFVAHKRPLATATWHKYALGVDFETENTLDGALGAQLAQGLRGDNEKADADLLYVMDAAGAWRQFYLDGDGVWREYGSDNAATDTIASWQSFWVRRRGGGAPSEPVYYGPVYSAAEEISFRAGDWHMIAWPFAQERREDTGGEGQQGWGFSHAGAQTGTSWLNADLLIAGEGAQQRFYYLHTSGRWCQVGSSTPALNLTLRLGEAYYYLHRGSGFGWTAEQ